MDSQEQEALARQLYAIHEEAMGYYPQYVNWENEPIDQREAWIQVAQFVEARSNRPSWMSEEQLKEDNENYKRWGYGIPDHK